MDSEYFSVITIYHSPLILRYRWDRLHVLFTLAATYITHHTDMKTYLITRCLHKSYLLTSLIKDYTDGPTTMLQLKVLAIIGKIISGPWFKRFYHTHERQVHHLGFRNNQGMLFPHGGNCIKGHHPSG